jgi:hypothetical protein
MADKINVDMIVKAIAEGFEDVGGKIGGLNKQTEETDRQSKKTKGSLLELYAGIQLAGQAAEIAKAAFDKMFEAGQRGAMVEQTSQSFELLAKTAETTADVLLGKMADASRGTVDNMTMMSSTLTLTAGVSKEMQIALVEAAPTLMEIAKAANKVNPSLGDTAHLYESIATGIKRGSPLILDNLGIVVKVGEANEEYAKAVGKAVDQLTAEEKILALLNATQKAGNTLIQQAGGDVGSLTDEYEKNKAELKNLSDEMKRNLSPSITEYVKVLNDSIRALNNYYEGLSKVRSAIIEHGNQMSNSAASQAEYTKEMNRAANAAGYRISKTGDLITKNGELIQSEFLLTATQREINRQVSIWNAESGRYRAASGVYASSIAVVADEMFDFTKLTEDQAKAWKKLDDEQKKYVDRLIEGKVGKLYSEYEVNLSGLQKKESDLREELEKLTKQGYSPLSEKMQEVIRKIGDTEDAQYELTLAREKDISMMLYQNAVSGLSASAALALAESMGLIDESTRAVNDALLKLQETHDLNKDGLIEGKEETENYIKALGIMNETLNNLDGKTVTAGVIMQALVSAASGIAYAGINQVDSVRGITGSGTFTSGHRDSGGPVFAGQTYWVGERGPEPVTFPADGHITPAQTSQKQSDALDELNRNFDWFRRSFGSELRDAFLLARDSG